jgi:hypothetical protein
MSMRQNDSMLRIDLYEAGKSVQPLNTASAKLFEINAMHWQPRSSKQPKGPPAMFTIRAARAAIAEDLRFMCLTLGRKARDDERSSTARLMYRWLSDAVGQLSLRIDPPALPPGIRGVRSARRVPFAALRPEST